MGEDPIASHQPAQAKELTQERTAIPARGPLPVPVCTRATVQPPAPARVGAHMHALRAWQVGKSHQADYIPAESTVFPLDRAGMHPSQKNSNSSDSSES